ncbi:uncharacterized protein [Antedon mediterranea]|uniref:uncharacterized protein n=1 Tax=Antedon mediterranea TaxID=105859 RepID=UPI003AF60DC1
MSKFKITARKNQNHRRRHLVCAPRRLKMNIEKLILLVQQNKILYDKSSNEYKQDKQKADVWKAIGNEVGVDGESAKKKWINLRDSLQRTIKTNSTKSGDAGGGGVKKYKWADQMHFLVPYLEPRQSSSSLDFLNLMMDDQVLFTEELDLEDTTEESIVVAPKRSAPSKPASSSSSKAPKYDNVGLKIVDYLESKEINKTPKKNKDALELFFESTFQTVKSFPKIKQIQVKKAITSLVFDIEEEIVNEE